MSEKKNTLLERLRLSSHYNFYRNALWQYGIQIVKYLLPLIVIPYLTRVLEPEGYAVYAYLVSFMTFVQVFVEYGFNLSGTRQIVEAKTAHQKNLITGSIMQARLLLTLFALLVVVPVALAIPLTRDNFVFTLLFFIGVCLRVSTPDFVFQGEEDLRPLTTRYLISKGASTLLTFAFVHSFDDILWVPILDIVSGVIAILWSFAAMKKRFGLGIARASWRSSFRELKRSGLYCFSNATSAVYTSFSTLFIGVALTNQSEIAFWSVSMTAIAAMQSLYGPITTSLYPHLMINKDVGFAKTILFRSAPILILTIILFAVGAPVVMLILGGPSYMEGVPILRLLSPLLFFSYYASVCGWPVLGALGKVKEITLTGVVAALFCIGALLAAGAFGFATMVVICVVRVVSEALLCAGRVLFCVKFAFQGTRA